MKKRFSSFFQRLTVKKAASVLYLIIIFHIGLTAYILHNNELANRFEMRNRIFQKITNDIYLLKALPTSHRKVALSAMDDPYIQATLSAHPHASMQFTENTYWEIMHVLEKTQNNFFISIQINKTQWLNIKGELYERLVMPQLIFMLIDLFVFGVILVLFWYTRRFSAPLNKIKLSAESLGIDQSIKPIDVYGPKQVREVSQALNQMQNRIAQLIRHRTQLLASISHDLRTPIMRAQLRAQFIADSDYKTQLLAELDEMEKMISETLAFAHESVKNETLTHIDLVSLLGSICDDAVDMGHDVKLFSNQHRVAFTGRPLALKRAFTNVINNAIRYAGNARVNIIKRNKFIFIKIEDNGPGIDEDDLEKVFEPFYRSEHPRSSQTRGVGLGLSVVRDIIAAHHGVIQLKNKKSGGLKVIIKLSERTS